MNKSTKGRLFADLAILAVAALVFAALASPKSVTTMAQSKSSPVYRGASRDSVSLQCAVTWEASAIVPMLDILKELGVNITFAVSGEWAEANPGLVKRMYDEGHEVAVMGYEPGKDGGAAFVKQDVAASISAVERACGEHPSTYYCGTREASVSAKAGEQLGLTTVLCTADLDCSSAEPELIIKRLASAAKAGSIINIQPTSYLLNALPQIVNNLKNMGLAIVPVHKMLYN